MRYIRTIDGRIIEESKLKPGLKQTCITLIRKRDNKTLTQIICDDMDNYVEMIAVGEYCKCHKINPKDIKLERIALLNEVLKQSDTIEELCDYVFLYDSQNELVIIDLKKTNLYCLKGSLKDGSIRDVKLAILTDKGLIYVAKMNKKGELELL